MLFCVLCRQYWCHAVLLPYLGRSTRTPRERGTLQVVLKTAKQCLCNNCVSFSCCCSFQGVMTLKVEFCTPRLSHARDSRLSNIYMRAQPVMRSVHRASDSQELDNKCSGSLARSQAHLQNLGGGSRHLSDSRCDLLGGVTAHQVSCCKLQRNHKGRRIQLEEVLLTFAAGDGLSCYTTEVASPAGIL